MKKVYRFLLFLLLVNAVANMTYAQNTLVYFRYDMVPNNIGKVIAIIDSINERTDGRFILYYENQVFESNKYDELVSSKDFLRYTSIYEPENEESAFSQLCCNLLSESVNGMNLRGDNDKEWKFIFVLSSATQKQDLMRLISINSLKDRLGKIQFIIYDEMSQVHKETYKQLIKNNGIMVLEY